MRFFYQNQANESGIYKILNVHNGRFYIGQCSQFKERWFGHKASLLKNKNQNKFLLNDFNKCKLELGNDDFLEFHILEAMPNSSKEERNKREEFYIKEYYDNQENCYNFHRKSDALPRRMYSKNPEITKQILSEKGKAQWANPEIREKRLRTCRSEEFRKKQAENQKRVAENPDYRKQQANNQRRVAENLEYRKRQSENQKRVMQDPEHLKRITEKIKVTCNNPDFKKRQSEVAKLLAKDPEYVKKRTENQRRVVSDPKHRKQMSEISKQVYRNKIKEKFGFQTEEEIDKYCIEKKKTDRQHNNLKRREKRRSKNLLN